MRILVCIKDHKYREKIKQCIQSVEYNEEVSIETYTTFPTGQRKYDMAFLDIRIDEKRVFDVGVRLYQMNRCINFYMYDNYQYIHKFFVSYGFQYILRNEDDLIIDELKRAYQNYLDIHCLVILTNEKHQYSFYPRDIQYIEDDHHYMKVVIGNHQYEGIIDDYEIIKKRLITHHFIQVHPCYLVNAGYIMEYKSHEIIMKNFHLIPSYLQNSDIMKAVVKAF